MDSKKSHTIIHGSTLLECAFNVLAPICMTYGYYSGMLPQLAIHGITSVKEVIMNLTEMGACVATFDKLANLQSINRNIVLIVAYDKSGKYLLNDNLIASFSNNIIIIESNWDVYHNADVIFRYNENGCTCHINNKLMAGYKLHIISIPPTEITFDTLTNLHEMIKKAASKLKLHSVIVADWAPGQMSGPCVALRCNRDDIKQLKKYLIAYNIRDMSNDIYIIKL